MDEKDLKKLTDGIDQKYEEVKGLVEGKATAEDLEKARTDLSGMIEAISMVDEKPIVEYVKEVQGHFNTLEAQINEITKKATHKGEHPEITVDKFLTGDDWKNAVKEAKGGGRPHVKVLTVASDLTAGTTSPVILPENQPGVEFAPRADTPIYNLVQKGTVSGDKVSWIERTLASESPGAAMTAESSAFGESDALWTKVEASVKKITDAFRATNEILEDTEFVRSEIMSMLSTNIPHLRETGLLTGANDATKMNGLVTAATAFSLPSGVDASADPNAVDGLRAAILQCKLGYNGSNAYTKGFIPNAVVLNPVDAHNIGGLKDANGLWLLPGWYQGMKFIDGIPVIESTDMTAGSYLVGDLSVAKYFVNRAMQVKFWDQYDTDPMYDFVLFTASERGCQKISNIGAYGLITGTIAAAVTAVTA